MTSNDQISNPGFALLVLMAAILAISLASLLKRLGVIAANPLKYLPHLVLLFTIAVSAMISDGMPTILKSLTVLSAVIGIWLVAVWLSSEGHRWISRKSTNAR